MAPGGGFARPGVPRGKALNSISITGAQGGQDNFLENGPYHLENYIDCPFHF